MKSLTILFLIISTSICNAQIETYYKNAFNHSSDSLKKELNQIISNHTEFPYTSSATDVWDILKQTDKDPNDSNNVILIYSGRSVNAAQEYNSGRGWSREHVWAKSRGDFGTDEGAGTDVHHLRPCDVSVNSTRNNRNFDDCVTCKEIIDNGFNTGSNTDRNLWTFDPPDSVKGDIARMIFYMVIRYEGIGQEPDLELTNTLLGKTDKSSLQAVKSTLLAWSSLDKVSNWERNRNEIIYRDYQRNRNPFIDYPELAEYLWGDNLGQIWKPVLSANNPTLIEDGFSIYPNPTTGRFFIKGEYEKIEVYNSMGKKVQLSNSNKPDLSDKPSGNYQVHIMSESGDTIRLTITKK